MLAFRFALEEKGKIKSRFKIMNKDNKNTDQKILSQTKKYAETIPTQKLKAIKSISLKLISLVIFGNLFLYFQ